MILKTKSKFFSGSRDENQVLKYFSQCSKNLKRFYFTNIYF